MSIGGRGARAAILLAWLGLFAHHVVRHAAPGLAAGAVRDQRTVFAAQSGRTLHYRIVDQTGAALGNLSCGLRSEGGRWRQDLAFGLDGGSPFLAALRLAAAGAGLAGDRDGIAGSLEIAYDDRLRPAALQGAANLFGTSLSADLAIDHRGLIGAWSVGGIRREIAMPAIDGNRLAGIDLALAMPPGLAAGDAWTTRSLGLAGMSLAERSTTHRAIAAERIDTAAGPRPALRVESLAAGAAAATSWIDERGTVLRLRLSAGPGLELVRIVRDDGALLWPDAADGAPRT